MRTLRVSLGLVLTGVLPSFGAVSSPGPDSLAPAPGSYRGVFASQGKEIPFQFELAKSGDLYTAALVNGRERTVVDKVSVEAGVLLMVWSGYGNSLRATIADGTLSGTLKISRRGGVVDELPVTARHGEGYRFFPAPDASPANFAGRFEVAFARRDGSTSPAVAELEQEGAAVTGTFLTETGDQRFLAGEAKGNNLYLSTFFGSSPSLHVATLNADGTLSGEQWSGKAGYSTWKAKPNPKAALRDPLGITQLKPGYDGLAFTFPNIDGQKVSLSDPRYRGKVVLVTISGSWCPNCHDETAFMAPFYKENRERGLESIELMYEYSGDFQEAAAAVRRFKEKFGVEYELLIAGVSDKDKASETLPMLSEVYAYPTTIVIDRRGKVRRIHTGFTGPGTGEHYREFVSEFTEFIDGLLAEGT